MDKRKLIMEIVRNNLFKYFGWKPKVHSIDYTIDYIIQNHCSVSRYGDGEFSVIVGNGNGFQKYDAKLANKLSYILTSKSDNHIVCICDVFGNLNFLKDDSIEFNNGLLNTKRIKWIKLLSKDKEYYNTFFTRPYNMFRDKSNSARWFSKIKNIWDGEEILLVEGEKSRLGIGNDLFSNAKKIERILCPAENAFDKYDDIVNKVLEQDSGKLVLIALGMTATVLAYDLHKLGYWAIDIGHIDIEYEWFLRGAAKKIAIPNKYVNEVADGHDVGDINDEEYKSQIIARII